MHGCDYHKTRNKTRLRKAQICQHTQIRIRPTGFSTAERGIVPCWTQAVSCRIPTAKVRARFHASECGNCGDRFLS
jgi:hypothetical protein